MKKFIFTSIFLCIAFLTYGQSFWGIAYKTNEQIRIEKEKEEYARRFAAYMLKLNSELDSKNLFKGIKYDFQNRFFHFYSKKDLNLVIKRLDLMAKNKSWIIFNDADDSCFSCFYIEKKEYLTPNFHFKIGICQTSMIAFYILEVNTVKLIKK